MTNTNLTDRVEAFRFKNRNGEIVRAYPGDLADKSMYTIADPKDGNEEDFFGKISNITGYQRLLEPNSLGRFEGVYIEEDKRRLDSKRELGVQIHLVNAGNEKRTLRGVVHEDKRHKHPYKEHLIVDLLDVIRIQ